MEIAFREFESGDEEAFRLLNESWIEEFFELEAKDVEILSDPQRSILAGGGAIVMALAEGKRVGCCALLAMGNDCFEVGKMAVAEELRGRGIGRKLLAFAIEHARGMGACRLYLETNRKLQNAIHLYESAGFTLVPPDRAHASPYSRSDLKMELLLPQA
jgi:GNAT superfamily N-acetyltransferase